MEFTISNQSLVRYAFVAMYAAGAHYSIPFAKLPHQIVVWMVLLAVMTGHVARNTGPTWWHLIVDLATCAIMIWARDPLTLGVYVLTMLAGYSGKYSMGGGV